jgi:hypothetical protein
MIAMGRVLVATALIACALSMSATAGAANDDLSRPDGASDSVSLVPSGISAAEMQDLLAVAAQKGVPLSVAIERYAWHDDFARLASAVRAEFPLDFAGAEITGGQAAWIGFVEEAPADVAGLIAGEGALSAVAVEVLEHLGTSAIAVEHAIEAVHAAVWATAGVASAATTHDAATRVITTTIRVDSKSPDTVLAAARAAASSQVEALLQDLGAIGLSSTVVASTGVLGGPESSSVHMGGENVSSCTTAFGTRADSSTSGERGIATAGHCPNAQVDDGATLTFRGGHEGTHGDFQWHTGPQTETDNFYAGSATNTEVNSRDVSSIGAPTVGQTLCRNGVTSHQDCQEVRKLNVCFDSLCNLVQMGAHLSAGGDSGGPVFWGNAAYGVHQGWMYDPAWPFDRELFSRADRIDNALSVFIATN